MPKQSHAIKHIFIRKFGIYLVLFISIFVFLIWTYLPVGIVLDNDSDSYLYLVKNLGIPNLMRPIVYPSILLLASLAGKNIFLPTLFIVQTLFLTTGLILVYCSAQTVFRSKSLALGITIFYLLNLQVTQYVNRMNPEVALTSTVILLVYCLLKSRDQFLFIIPSVICMTIASFIKPIFLYFPIAILCMYLLYYLRRIVSKKQIISLLLILVFLYLIPITLWAYGNKIKNGYFTFSNIKEINTIGKLIQYKLIDTGPEHVSGFPIKKWVQKNVIDNPYEFMKSISDRNKYSGLEANQFELALYEYGQITLRNHIPQFILKSIMQIPSMLQYIPRHSIECEMIAFQTTTGIRRCMSRLYIVVINNFYTPILSLSIPTFLLISVYNFLRYCYVITKNNFSLYSHAYILLCTLIFYFVFAASIGTYDGEYGRMLSPIYVQIVLLISMTIYDGWIAATRVSRYFHTRY